MLGAHVSLKESKKPHLKSSLYQYNTTTNSVEQEMSLLSRSPDEIRTHSF